MSFPFGLLVIKNDNLISFLMAKLTCNSQESSKINCWNSRNNVSSSNNKARRNSQGQSNKKQTNKNHQSFDNSFLKLIIMLLITLAIYQLLRCTRETNLSHNSHATIAFQIINSNRQGLQVFTYHCFDNSGILTSRMLLKKWQ